jgi:hypothetical protein
MIICFVGNWETEVNIFKRDMRIGNILGECDYELDLCKIDSNYVVIYQVGNINVYDVYEIVKNKIEINHNGVDFYLPISGNRAYDISKKYLDNN